MQISPVSYTYLYEQVKYWGTIITVGWSAFKAFQWVKDLKEKDIAEIKSSLAEVKTSLEKQTNTLDSNLKDQTASVVSELKELRADFRTYMPQMAMRRARAAKTVKAPKRKK